MRSLSEVQNQMLRDKTSMYSVFTTGRDTEAVLELDPNDLFFDPGAVNPDWILSSFDLWPHLDTFDLPADCEIFDPPGSIISLPVGTQMASPNAQEPPAKYNARHGPQLDNWLLSVDNDTLVLPQLGGDNDKSLHLGSHFQVPKVQEARRVDMKNCAQMMLERPLWKAVSLANLPSKAKMDHCIDLFFINFRPPVSFIHHPTFDPTTVPEILLFAVIAIGARFSSMTGAALFSNSMVEISRRMLIVMNEQDQSATHSEQHLTAQLLFAIHGRASGHRRLFGYSRDLRSSLVRHARQAGLFHEPKLCQRLSSDEAVSTESKWQAWIAAERQRRLGWAIYDLDANVGILHNERPTFSIGDMALSLPEEDVRWEASTAFSWIALHPWQSSQEGRTDFRQAARECFDPNLSVNTQMIDDQHLYIVTITLGRFLWSIKELQASPIMDVGPENWPLVQHKRTLLLKLGQFLISPETIKSNETKLRHVVERLLIIHLCHLYGAGDLMDWLPALLRARGQHKEIRARMTKWGLEDGARLREVAYHSAQILALSRSFPFNCPNESFYVFYGGAALWCASTLLKESRRGIEADGYAVEVASVLRLDTLCARDDGDKNQLEHWLGQAIDVRVCLFGIPDLGSEDSPIQVLQETSRILENMRVWELPKGFNEFIRQLIHVESRRK
ncbi:hypothetical protein FAUST_7165 [Fusarium austroamericanum]|uniref:Xylanolytic transcriptional activator regulatory domain-containing protein n=1 Tax=Fusarium austroamericanum TaxID=282268 RepID=A0AAN5Z6Z9_FUSAU|nr:hypothetical protein FAUST_7165 [Fusarium austroamericanum]